MQLSCGELIRQVRRQYNLTQTALGGDRFSKSYVSAVERNKITPSAQALQYFAEQLDKPEDYFSNLLQQSESMKQLAILDTPEGSSYRGSGFQGEEPGLLDILLENPELSNMTTHYQFQALGPETIALLPPFKQARYHFLVGLMAQEEHNLEGALQEFERALGLAPKELQVSILNELGRNYYLAQQYHTALTYHLRALRQLQQQSEHFNGTADTPDAWETLRFKIEFNCGNDYRAVGAYSQASKYYESARRSLSPAHDMKTAASLYWGLGYCIYGAIDEVASSGCPASLEEEIEREYQRANSFLLQSRTLYQVGGDWLAEAQARLMQARVLLDFSMRRQQVAQAAAANQDMVLALSKCFSLLDEAEEQCRQVLLTVQELSSNVPLTPGKLDAIVYPALSYLIRVFVQRALLARLGGYADTAARERTVASYLCQQVLQAFPQSDLPWALIGKAATVKLDVELQQSPSSTWLFHAYPEENDSRSPISQVEVYFVASELAEELAHIATEPERVNEWDECANRWLQAALSKVKLVAQASDHDTGYLARSCRRSFTLLEDRLTTFSSSDKETIRTLVSILNEGFSQLPSLVS